MSSSEYHNSENEGAGPSKKKKIKYNQVFKKSWTEEEQFKKWIKQGKDEYFACAIKIFLLKILAD
ncbi:unnamed protein product [Acanthoscelides obtectus]|uniref:Uncharacterized protein n=1 Tax=Acanthoscelides obtectus TaxID=200917 RepID=A0A9P0M9X2_ACAOB|nr:unnamed protein product [Acanthoscelides obtectus]CAK1670587.1 hypothetical protein AOBTE_LOCUS27693 [Acanthoscelides obtectus]